jgi:putative transposase
LNEDDRNRIALWRLSVLGPLISAHLEHGDRADHFRRAAQLTYELPDGRRVRLSSRTIEAWHYAWRRKGLDGLRPGPRADSGSSRAIRKDLVEWILRAKREKPRRSIRRIMKMLVRARIAGALELTKSSVHRLLLSHGLSIRPSRHGDKERRAFRHRAPGDLWMGDVMHSRPVVAPDGRLRKAYLHLFVDSATRLIPHAAFRLGEQAHDFEAVFKQALMKYGRPRVLYLDRGAAQIADSLKLICGELSIRLLHCEARDPQAKGAVERLVRTCRDEIEDELPEEPIPLTEINSLLWSWIAAEYHTRIHGGTGKSPLDHWLEGAHEIRPLPRNVNLDELFLHRERRKVRKDGAVRFGGHFLEVASSLAGREVELRIDPERPDLLPRVFLDGAFVCDTVLLDPVQNSFRQRRRTNGKPEPGIIPTGLDPLQLTRQEHIQRIRPPRTEDPNS